MEGATAADDRYRKLSARGKNKPQVITALGREFLAFIWAIAVHVESKRTIYGYNRSRPKNRARTGHAVTVVDERHTERRTLD